MDIVPLHKRLIAHVAALATVDLWNSTSPATPVTVALMGQPTASEPLGYLLVATRAVSMISALDWCLRTITRDQLTDLCPGWVGPTRHAFAFEWSSFDRLLVTAWSATGALSIGNITKPPHPEIPADTNLIAYDTRVSSMDRTRFNAQILQQLERIESFSPLYDHAMPV